MAQAALKHPPIEPRPALRVVPGFGGLPPTAPLPPLVSNPQIALVVFLTFEAMLFAGLIGAYVMLRTSNLAWPPANLPRLPIALTWLNTGVLFLSAYAMHHAVAAMAKDGQPRFHRYLAWTAALGSLFLAVQGGEWVKLIQAGLTMSVHVYGGMFFSLIGLHALHVVGAVVWLLTVYALARRGRYQSDHLVEVRLCATYWYFVTGLWAILFGLVYLA